MMRLRRKFVLYLSGVLLAVFLFFYALINYSISPQKTQALENGLQKHNVEVGEIKKQIDNIQSKNVNNKDEETQIHQNDGAELDKREMQNEAVIHAAVTFRGENQKQCSFRSDIMPVVDVQMLDIYNELTFDNPNGGEWKQGWRINYDIHEWNSHHKLKVFVVPHSHNDPGWIKTFDEYYDQTTKSILTNMLAQLTDNGDMTFIWAEISYFSRWYDNLSTDDMKKVKNLVKRNQLEFVTGGWVMPDEANSHWLCLLQQLTEGHTWLKTNLNVTPTSSWSIDPFGQSATMPLLLKESGFQNLLIQRTHYSVKKRLAQKKELEFRWRQLWDTTGDTELFTHMMPFYSYDVPHTCGPDPKVCCQFDFKRLHGFGLSCPWKIPPQVIDDNNVAKRAELIIDQWRKKSTLYKTRSVLIPLGDDFRYSQSTEWEAQRTNYQKLFDYINNEPSLNVEAKFGTLQEYFDSVHLEKRLDEFPSLSGDFFTYADRDDHYWSGYFTSRPFHKRLDRVLMNYLRSAQMLHSWSQWDADAGFDFMLTQATRALSLFQHHDGVTGTAKDHVMRDYAKQMNEALILCKNVIQQSAYRYLTKPSIYQPDYKFTYFNMDDARTPNPNESRQTIILGEELPTKYIVLHNSLPYVREEVVEFYVSRPLVMVTDLQETSIPSQVSPVWAWHKSIMNTLAPQASTTKYKLVFKAKVPPLGLSTYMIHSTSSVESSIGTTFAKITILTKSPFSVVLADYPHQVEFAEPREISIRISDGPGVSFNKFGLLKSMSVDSSSPNVPVHLEFLKYGARHGSERSGAYLFLPDGPASQLEIGSPAVLVTQGNLESSVTTGLRFAIHENILSGGCLEIRNLIDIGDMDNTEIIMRMSTAIKSEDVFYTDLNGLQLIKRQRFSKLPLQANYYPVPSQMFIQDDSYRLTLLSGQPLGGSSLQSGQLEIMQDRRLIQDDNRGLGQGVLDNQPVLNIFKLAIENLEQCNKLSKDYPAGFLTSNTFMEMKTLLHPMEKLIWHENDWIGVLPHFGLDRTPFETGVEVAVLRDLPHVKGNGKGKSSMGLVVHRNYLEECSTESHRMGLINIRQLLNLDDNQQIFTAPLTLLKREAQVLSEEYNVCPKDIKAFIINR
ncbi:alpha-mannosidase 2 isoform X2 [Bradysia coprophila]|uniref:alpha-mannosidase 2 isoform X2 n=1 Tax=Bradysia coprophila TaxID=38358 RepID=UPI00187DAB93|nr:alpha-mannosidase 2 isoform X2 [Bradysia coprophila]